MNKTFTEKRDELLKSVLWDMFDDQPLTGINKAKELGFFDEAREMKDNYEIHLANDQAESDAYNDGIREGAIFNGMTGKEMVDDLFQSLGDIFKPARPDIMDMNMPINEDGEIRVTQIHQERFWL